MMKKTLALAVLATVVAAGTAEARDQIRVAGSSTVFPFTTRVAEEFGRTTGFKTPIVESTGTGGGFKLFCSGVGVNTTDISNASRQIKKSEVENCHANGVKSITEVQIGFDGIVLANSKAAPEMDIPLKTLFLALAKDVPDGKGGLMPNPNKLWSDIDPALPKNKIEVLGPPPTSGTRDSFNELAMEGGCNQIPELAAMKKTDEKKHAAVCQGIREDGAFIEAGENDILIVRKLEANKDSFGVFGYSFLDQNQDKIRGNALNGVAPTYDNISTGKYPVARSMFIYVKDAHVDQIPGIREFITEYTSDKAWGPDGYLADKGLIAMPAEQRAKWRAEALKFANNVGM